MRKFTVLLVLLVMVSPACSAGGTKEPAAPDSGLVGGWPVVETLEIPPESPTGEELPQEGDKPVPDFNPFESMTPEEEACLREGWDDETFEEITTFQRPPGKEEEEAMFKCLNLPSPGEGEGPPKQGEDKPAPDFNPFEKMTPEEEECLREGWDDETFEALTTLQRPPDKEEGEILFECIDMPPPPGEPGGEVGEPDPNGSYYHQVMLAYSSDGLNWTVDDEPVRDHASVPEIAALPDGTLIIYYVDGIVDDVDAIRQAQDGSWVDVDFVFEERPTQKAYDPDVVLLPDGRLRLFYFGPPAMGIVMPSEEAHAVYSAISEDGVVFTSEPGKLITVQNVTDPSVVQLPDGTWLLALSRGPETLLASSSDGDGFELTGSETSLGGVPELTLLPDGRLRLFVTGQGGIRSLVSSDGGASWQEEEGMRIDGKGSVAADPSVIQLDDGSWIMTWKRFMPDTSQP